MRILLFGPPSPAVQESVRTPISSLTCFGHNGNIYSKTFTVLLHFSDREAFGMEFGRERYLKQLLEREHNGLIKVITGMRRSGKSFLMDIAFRVSS